jgi:hypothetical protein
MGKRLVGQGEKRKNGSSNFRALLAGGVAVLGLFVFVEARARAAAATAPQPLPVMGIRVQLGRGRLLLRRIISSLS